jgi:hypothetical protein
MNRESIWGKEEPFVSLKNLELSPGLPRFLSVIVFGRTFGSQFLISSSNLPYFPYLPS